MPDIDGEANAVPKIVLVVIAVLVVAFVVAYPNKSAHLVHETWGHTKSIAHGLGAFVNKL